MMLNTILIFATFVLIELALMAVAMSVKERLEMKEAVREMFFHGYNSYMTHAFPKDELQPISCSGIETWGGYSLTLIDSLDTLVVMGDYDEFNRRVDWIIAAIDFDRDVNVSVFETNIRVLGGLLAAHLIYEEGIVSSDTYSGGLLDLAADLGYRLLPAFDTPTGIPYGTVNLRDGVPPEEIQVTSTASGGTFMLEFTMLSRLTGDPAFELAAKAALLALYHRRSQLGLVGNHINISSGEWTHKDAGIGAGVDSFYEYQLKSFIMFRDTDLLHMFNESREAILKHLHKPPWYVEVHMFSGITVWPLYNSLQGFWPGTQALSGNLQLAKDTVRAMHGIWRHFGAVPEGFNLLQGKVQPGQSSYPLRPELIESIYYMYTATKDPLFLQMGKDAVYSLNTRTRTGCGFATIKDVSSGELTDRMESFFLSETSKYLYLLFDEENRFNRQYVFTTEGHPFPIRANYQPYGTYQRTSPPPPSSRFAVRRPRPGFIPQAPLTKRDVQCPRPSYWQRTSVCEMEIVI